CRREYTRQNEPLRVRILGAGICVDCAIESLEIARLRFKNWIWQEIVGTLANRCVPWCRQRHATKQVVLLEVRHGSQGYCVGADSRTEYQPVTASPIHLSCGRTRAGARAVGPL